MLKILGIVAVVLLIAIAGILVYAATKPDSFRVERTRDIKTDQSVHNKTWPRIATPNPGSAPEIMQGM